MAHQLPQVPIPPSPFSDDDEEESDDDDGDICDAQADEDEPEAGTVICTKQINKFENTHMQQVQNARRIHGGMNRNEMQQVMKRIIAEIREVKRANRE